MTIIRQQQAMTVISFRKPGHHNTAGSNANIMHKESGIKDYNLTAGSNDCHRIAGSNVIIRQQQAKTVNRFLEARPSSDSRKQCHQT
jgi:hypothetical protein